MNGTQELPKRKTRKAIKVALTIDIDLESWALNYGEVPGSQDIRDEVIAMVEYMYDKRGVKVTVR